MTVLLVAENRLQKVGDATMFRELRILDLSHNELADLGGLEQAELPALEVRCEST